jgi:hypothetical protein
MFLATGILSKLMMIMMNCTIREDMPKCEIGHPIRLTCNRGRELRTGRAGTSMPTPATGLMQKSSLKSSDPPLFQVGENFPAG